MKRNARPIRQDDTDLKDASAALPLSNADRADNGLASLPGHSAARRAPDWLPRGARTAGAAIDLTAEILVGLALVGELVVVLANLILRDFAHHALTWEPEVSQLTLTIMAFIGGALAYNKGMHIALRSVIDNLPTRIRGAAQTLPEWIVLGTSLLLIKMSWDLVQADWSSTTPILGISVGWEDLPIAIGSALFAYYAARRLLRYSSKKTLAGGLVATALISLVYFSYPSWQGSFSNNEASVVVIALFVILLVIGVPISITLSILALFYAWGSNMGDLVTVPRQMGDGVNSFLLLAVPFFVFAGLIMAHGGLSKRIADLAELIIGRLRGGPLQVIVASMYVFSGMSGSKNADVVAVGLTMKQMAERSGYTPAESGAVLAASAAMGETIPPSIALLILGTVASVPIATLLVAGILPALVLAVGLMLLIFFRYRKKPLPPPLHRGVLGAARTVAASLPAVALPVIIAGGIILGIGTPTEVSSFAVVYGLLLGVFVYRQLGWRSVLTNLREAAELTGFILYIVSSAAAFAFTLTIMQLPQQITQLVTTDLGDNKSLFLVLSCVVLVILGCVLEGVPAILITVPLLYPVADSLGIWNVQYGILLLIAMGIGTFTPPLGIGTYVTCSVTGATPGELARKIWPYLLVLFVGLLVVAFFPDITKALPGLLHISAS